MVANFSAKRKPNRWLVPVIYLGLVIVNFLPLITKNYYDPRETQEVIIDLLKISLEPYKSLGWVFHLATIILLILIASRPAKLGRVLAVYMGLNYLIIAFAQNIGMTAKYGWVVHTGALLTCLILSAAWFVVAWRGRLAASFVNIPILRWLLAPLALMAFWSPYAVAGEVVVINFNPVLLLTSVDYGLAFCFTTPVFIFLLTLFYPHVDPLAYRLTAFSGFLFGLFNMTHFVYPERIWMGVLHLPLLVLSLYALVLARIDKRQTRYSEIAAI